MNRNISQFLVVIFLLILLVIRIIENKSEWIQTINYFCLIIAAADLYIKLYIKSHTKNKFNYVTTIIIIIFIILIIVAALIFTGKISLDAKSTDIITIIVLMLSLPSDLYCKIINKKL